jgi:hypothetical protein
VTTIDVAHWVGRAQHLREEDGGYTFESLAMEMIRTLGWYEAGDLARKVAVLCDADLSDGSFHTWGEKTDETARTLYDCLGWTQATLFAAWLRNLGNFRMARDEMPGGCGIAPYRGGAA